MAAMSMDGVRDSADHMADRAVAALAPEMALFADRDVAEFGRSLVAVMRGVAAHPVVVARAGGEFAAQLCQIPGSAMARWLGADAASPVELDPRDRRFADAAWSDNPAFSSVRSAYVALTR